MILCRSSDSRSVTNWRAWWNKELYDLVCGAKQPDQKDRTTLLASLHVGEAAVIAAVAGALVSLGAGAAVAAAAAPILVRRFIWPAKDELCAAWEERLAAQG